MDPLATTINSYDEIAEEYCERTLEEGDREFQEKMLDRTLNQLGEGARIIDLGCGDGRDTSYLCEKGADAVGIDLSRSMIDLARRKHPDCAFIQSDMLDLIFPNDTFQGAWANASIINMPKSELSHIEKEVHRILGPEGIFVFSIKEGEREGFEDNGVIEGYPRYFSYYTPEEIKERLNLFNIYQVVKCPEKIFGSDFSYCFARKR